MSVIDFSGARDTDRRRVSGFSLDDQALIEFQDAEHREERVPLGRPAQVGWTNQETADLARAEHMIRAARPDLEFTIGATDEGEPWCVVTDGTGDVLIHICRIDGAYQIDSPSLPKVIKGFDLRTLIDGVREIQHSEDLETAGGTVTNFRRPQKVYFHPAVMMTALFWALVIESDPQTAVSPLLPHSDTNAAPETDAAVQATALNVSPSAVQEPELSAAHASSSLDAGLAVMLEEKHQKHQTGQQSAASHALTTLAIAAGFMTAEHFEAQTEMRLGFDLTAILQEGTSDAKPDSGEGVPVTQSWSLAELTAFWNALFETDFVSIADIPVEDPAASHDMAEIDAQILQNGVTVEQLDGAAMQVQAAINPVWLHDIDSVLEIFKDTDVASGSVAPVGRETSQLSDVSEMGESSPDTASEPFARISTVDIAFSDLSKSLVANEQAIVLYTGQTFEHAVSQYDAALADMLSRHTDLSSTANLPDQSHERSDSTVADSAHDTADRFLVETDRADSVLGGPSYRDFTDAARDFLNARMAEVNVDVLIYKNEIVFIDETAFTAQNISASLSWSMHDGGIISFVGVADDINSYLHAHA